MMHKLQSMLMEHSNALISVIECTTELDWLVNGHIYHVLVHNMHVHGMLKRKLFELIFCQHLLIMQMFDTNLEMYIFVSFLF